MRIMTVCLGNICRSPAAEAVLVHRLEAAGIEAEVSSAGTGPWHVGDQPHRMSRDEGETRGYAFTSVGRQFDTGDFEAADLILVMDSANEDDVLALARAPEDAEKVVRLGAFAGDNTGGLRDVPDPYGGVPDDFVAMYDQIEDAVDGLVRAIQDGTVEEISARHRRGSTTP